MLVLDGVNSNFFWGGFCSNPGTCGTIHSITITTKKGAKKGIPNSNAFGKSLLTPKTYMEPQHGGLEDAFPGKKWDFQVPAVSFQGCRRFPIRTTLGRTQSMILRLLGVCGRQYPKRTLASCFFVVRNVVISVG